MKNKGKPSLSDRAIEVLSQVSYNSYESYTYIELLSENIQELIKLFTEWGKEVKRHAQEPHTATSILNSPRPVSAPRTGKASDKVDFEPARFSMFAFKVEKREIHKLIFKAAHIDEARVLAHRNYKPSKS